MKTQTLKTLIKDLPQTGNSCGLIRQLAGVSAQKYKDAHRCMNNAVEDWTHGPDTTVALKHIGEQKNAVAQFVEQFGNLTVEQYLEMKK